MNSIINSTLLGDFRLLEKYPDLTAQDEINYISAYQNHDDNNAAQQVILASMKTVLFVAYTTYKSYSKAIFNGRIEVNDFIIEGCLGLYRALQTFDIKSGVRFISYAIYWVKASISEYIIQSSSAFHVGKSNKGVKSLFNKDNEILPYTDIETLIADKYLYEVELNECLHSKNLEDFALEHELSTNRSAALLDAISKLSEKERYIITQLFYTKEKPTLAMLGLELGVSLQRVEQIKKAAMNKIRKRIGVDHEL